MKHEQDIRNLIKKVEAEKKELDRRLRTLYSLLGHENDPKPNEARKPPKTHRGLGFVTTVLPYLSGGPATMDDMFKYLKKQPGMKDVSDASFKATVYSELKKESPRIIKREDGLFLAHPNAVPQRITTAPSDVQTSFVFSSGDAVSVP